MSPSLISGKKKAHKHELFGPVALGTTPGLSQGQTRFVPGTNPLCPRDKPPYFSDILSLTGAPLPDPAPTPPNTPKRTRNGPERTRTEPKWTEIKPSQVGRPGGGVCRDGGGVGAVREKENHYLVLHNGSPDCPRDKPSLSPGTIPGMKGGIKSLCVKSLCAFFACYCSRPAMQLFQCCNAIARCCSTAFGTSDVRTPGRLNVALQLLQRNFPEIETQLVFSLVTCRRGGFFRGVVFRTS